MPELDRNARRALAAAAIGVAAALADAQDLPLVRGAEAQPVLAGALRVQEALEFMGSPLAPADAARLAALRDAGPGPELVAAVQAVLDPYCLAMVDINPEARVKVLRGPAAPRLVQDGWRCFLVKVRNLAGTRAALTVHSPNAEPVFHRSTSQPEPDPENRITPGQLAARFLELELYRRRPMHPELSGLPLEYAILQAYTRERGRREARLGFACGHGSQDLGFRGTLDVLFDCEPSVKVVLRVLDADGSPTTASFTISDGIPRAPESEERGTAPRPSGVYPLPARRVASRDEFPDFYFQPQVYRKDGEHVFLPPGTYDVAYARGPEYLPGRRRVTVPVGVERHEEEFRLQRWIHLAALGWYSADHHVHAGGCSHYESPEAGVDPAAMLRQAQGEDLNISCVLTWGPCWYHQKTFFEGAVSALSTPANLMRYDVEVSGFPSSHAGHLVLLRLREDDYPGTEKIEDWPSWTLPILQWAKAQGGVVGYAHSGWGLEQIDGSTELPPRGPARFDGIGANEYIVTSVHGAVDFISAGDTPAPWELGIWYHTLNCGARTRISGETDFPCIFDDRVGMARTYAALDGELDFDAFTEALRRGRAYVSDGLSHILDLRVDGTRMGEEGSELRLDREATVLIRARAAAHLPPRRDGAAELIAQGGVLGKPYWHLEKARIGASRRVPVELVVNGHAVARREIEADGAWHNLEFEHRVRRSSWIALRIYPSSHTNPVFVLVDGAPVRASRESAAWCADAVDRCWEMKRPAIRGEERAAAEQAYDAARRHYRRVEAEASR